MDDLLKEFLAETTESLQILDAELVRFEQTPNDSELLGNIFRLLHTIKGTCGFLGLPRLEAVAHAGENVLDKFRDGALEVTPDAVTLIFEVIDCIRKLISDLAATGAEPDGDDKPLIARLGAMIENQLLPPSAAPEPATAPKQSLYERVGGVSGIDAACDVFYRKLLADEALKSFFVGTDMDRLQGMQRAFMTMALGGPNSYAGRDLTEAHARLVGQGLSDVHFDGVAKHFKSALQELNVAPADIDAALATLATTRDAILGRVAPQASAPAPEKTAAEIQTAQPAKVAKQPSPNTEMSADAKATSGPQTLRVNVDVLENLMTVVSELVLMRNQLLQILRSQPESPFAGPLQRLNQVTSELQESVMVTRMQPIGNAWNKLPRIIRDLSNELDKKIELTMHGAETELDRQVLDSIKDPLTHMVRNSADHGIELPAERVKAGKPETGQITLSARHEGGHIVLEISDDGRGIPLEKIKAKAITNGLVTAAEAEALSEQQIQQFIFKAGLSTAEKVTNVSGRGVGMDVVRTNIEKISGTIELRSTEGEGSRFIIKIPLTLAIVSALIVECCGERFAVPQNSVIELVGTTANSQHIIEKINGSPVLRLRNELLPLVSLQALLGLEREDKKTVESCIVVSQVGNFTFGIIVDRVFDAEEIVVKPVARILRHLTFFSGNTILGDGRVIMILDPNGIATAVGGMNVGEAKASKDSQSLGRLTQELVSLLIFRAGPGAPKAVPLSLIARLEEIDPAKVEPVEGRQVIQYRGRLMPLITLGKEASLSEVTGRRPVLVFSDNDSAMGFMVDEIIDIVEAPLDVDLKASGDGSLGSAIIAGKATDILDAAYYLKNGSEDWFGVETKKAFEQTNARRILLVDDSPFFRNLLTPLLKSAGYDVTTAENAETALCLYKDGEDFDIIVSDIEMPGMNGFDFASAIRKAGRWSDLPIIALSSHASPSDLERGRKAGFTDHVAKLDRELLLKALSQNPSNTRAVA